MSGSSKDVLGRGCGNCAFQVDGKCVNAESIYEGERVELDELCGEWRKRKAKGEERKDESWTSTDEPGRTRTVGTKETAGTKGEGLAEALREIDEGLAEIVEIENRIEELKKRKLELRETLCKHKGHMMAVLDRMGRSIKGDKRTRKKFGGRVKRVPKGEPAPGNEPAGEKGRERLKQLREAFGTNEFTAAQGAKVCGIEKSRNFHGSVAVALLGRWMTKVRPGVFRLVEVEK